MTPSLATALNQIRDDIAAILAPANLRQLCSQVGHSWQRIAGRDFSASVYCRARSRLPIALLERLLYALFTTTKPLVVLVCRR